MPLATSSREGLGKGCGWPRSAWETASPPGSVHQGTEGGEGIEGGGVPAVGQVALPPPALIPRAPGPSPTGPGTGGRKAQKVG